MLTTIVRLSNHLAYGSAPEGGDFSQLRKMGFRTLIDLRTHKEIGEEKPISEVERIAHKHGLMYYHLSMDTVTPQPAQVEEVRTRLASMPPPIFAFPDERAGVILVLHILLEARIEGRFAWTRAQELGFDSPDPKVREFITSYVDEHPIRPY
jgi:uncharacterized protein (TIGR01244 family)